MTDIYKGIKSVDGKVIMEGNNNEVIEICNNIGISRIERNMDTNEIRAVIHYITFDGRNEEITVPRSDYLYEKNLMKYQGCGMDIRADNVKFIVKHLTNEERKAPVVLTHSRIGFDKYKGMEIYKHQKAVGIESTYCGQYLIEPKGELDVVYKLLEEEILKYTPSKLILMAALSSITICYLSEIIEMNTVIFHLVGNSTTGKSTICKFAILLFGYPGVKNNGLFFTYNATSNALMKKMEGIYGVPVAIDELSMAGSLENNMVYRFKNGRNKDRLNKDSSQQENDGWLGVMFSNGEKSLIRSTSNNTGSQLRVIELSNIKWTKSAEHANKINEVIMNNYGHIGPRFAEYIMSIDKHELKKRYEKIKKILLEEFKKESVNDIYSERRIKDYAIIYLTGKLFSEMIEADIRFKDVVTMFVDIEKESRKERNFEIAAFEYVKSYISKYINKFETDKNKTKGEHWGYINVKEDYTEVEINPTKFNEILREGNYEDRDVVLKSFKENGILDCDKDRYTRKRTHGVLGKLTMIVLKIYE